MIRLKEKYRGKTALFLAGGPSILECGYDLSKIDRERFTVFIETKTLTPRFLEFGLEPDFYFMGFPEKSKDNNLQHFIYRSFMAGSKIRPLLRPEHRSVYDEMKRDFDHYFETWAPHKGPQKRYKWKAGVYMKDSPYDLLRHLPNTKIITRWDLFSKYFPDFDYRNPVYYFDVQNDPVDFDLQQYFNPRDEEGRVRLKYNSFLNSAAIAVYPLLNYMGFKKVFFLGMDMSILGSMEYSALHSFKSILHFRWYVFRTKKAFNADYVMNRPFFFRPMSEFADMEQIFKYKGLDFYRIFDDFKYAAPSSAVKQISFEQFLKKEW